MRSSQHIIQTHFENTTLMDAKHMGEEISAKTATSAGYFDALEAIKHPETYEHKAHLVATQHLNRYVFVRPSVKNKTVLDAACGTGYGCEIFKTAGFKKYLGIDIDAQALQLAKNRNGENEHISFLQKDLAQMGEDAISEPFDVFVSFETIEHFPGYDHFLDFIYSSLKDGGVLFISTPNRTITNKGKTFSDKPLWEHHSQEWILEEFTSLLQGHGFKIKKVYGQSFVFKRIFGIRLRGSRLLKKYTQWPLPIRWFTFIADPNFFILECSK